MIFPPPVVEGDRVVVVAPSSPFDRALVLRGMGFLATRYRVEFAPTLFERRGYLAGDDARRRDELQAAADDEGVRAIIAARGGYGASRFVHDVDWSGFERAPKWIAGFSDVTAIHVEAARRGFASIHGPMVASLGRSDARARRELVGALEDPRSERRFDDLDVVVGGRAEGRLAGGNLTLVHACAAAGKLRFDAPTILFLEDITERPFRVDRMLTTLRAGGHFTNVTGFAIGDFTACDPGLDGVTIPDVIRACLGDLGVPIVSGLPCGHDPKRNHALILGATATIEGGSLSSSAGVQSTQRR